MFSWKNGRIYNDIKLVADWSAQTTECQGASYLFDSCDQTRCVCEAATLELVAIPPREAGREGTRLAKGQKGVDIDYYIALLSRFLRPSPPCILLSALFIKNCLAAPVSPPNYLS